MFLKKKILVLALSAAFAGTGRSALVDVRPADDVTADRAPEVNRLIAAAKPGDELRFAKGEYKFDQSISVYRKKGLSVRAEKGTVFRARFKADGLMASAMVLFSVVDSEDLLFEGFVITTDHTPSATGRIVAVHPETREYDVRIGENSDFTGTEPLCIADTCDEFGAPDNVHSLHYMNSVDEDDGMGGKRVRNLGIPYKMVGPRLARVSVPNGYDLKWLDVGHRIVYRHLIGGGAFNFVNDRRVTVRDVEIWRNPSIVIVISPCSADFTFESLQIRPTPGSGALYSSNADGIHVAGMSGTLTIRNCSFEGMGDDPLNVHGKSSELHEYDPATGKAKCVWRLFHKEPRRMSKKWALAGDELTVYARKTFLPKGNVRVRETAGYGEMMLDAGVTPLELGDIVINNRDYPKVRISGCTVKNIRSRGFLLQTHDVEVRDCSFAGVGGAGIMAAPDVNNWFESGPTVGLKVENCTFERCARRPGSAGAFLVKVNHEGPIDAYPAGVHRDITVSGCTFTNCGLTNLCVASAIGVKVGGCVFTDCPSGTPSVFVNCEKVQYK